MAATRRTASRLPADAACETECPAGSIGYFEPWNKLCLYYGYAPPYPGQYVLGKLAGDPAEIRKFGRGVSVEICP